MIKSAALFLLIILSVAVLPSKDTEPFDFPRDENGKAVYSEVVEVPDVLKADLYIRGLAWFAKAFRSAQSVIQMQDKEAGKIIGKALTPVSVKNVLRITAGCVNYSITLDFKDGKYRYTFDQFIHDGSSGEYVNGHSFGELTKDKPSKKVTVKQWASIKSQVNETIQGLISSLKQAMAEKAAEKKDDWRP